VVLIGQLDIVFVVDRELDFLTRPVIVARNVEIPGVGEFTASDFALTGGGSDLLIFITANAKFLLY
jgi:hypothetical protein